ncbi:uncharacterized protein [Prorops nasuta]|uniref:uncharacterized protein n=1 Tax=Prorops nasuta TaxID=863751 RepID=UPI0034CDB3F2
MPKENTPVCGCGVVVDLQKSRGGSLSTRKLTIFIPKSSKARSSKKQQQEDARGPKNRTSPEMGSSSSVVEQSRPATKSTKQERRSKHSRRARSAERPESHYTYIDSGSSILGGGVVENSVPEAIYAIIPETPHAPATCRNETSSNCQNYLPNRNSPHVYAIPSMTSPPPTYDVAIAKTWQSGLPPTYDEYLWHKYAMLSRSHTPPPPWSDSGSNTMSAATSSHQIRRDLLSQTELRDYLAELAISGEQRYQQQLYRGNPQSSYHPQQQQQQQRQQQQIRSLPRLRTSRSQSETRAQQQRIATMYEDGAFCMETTALQSAIEHGVAFCNLM